MTGGFVGRGWAFPLGVGAGGGIAMADGDSKIEQSIRLILATSPGERPMRPDFGCNLRAFVFDPADARTAGLIAREVGRALQRWEPRIDLRDVAVDPHPDDPSALVISVSYTARATNDPRNLVFPFYLIPTESHRPSLPTDRGGEGASPPASRTG